MPGPRLASAEWLRGEPLRGLLEVLNRGGVETRVVGGAVRDALLGRSVGEVDLATSAPPEEVARLAAAAGHKVVPTGVEHGTVTVVAAGTPFEVTTLREDVETDGRHATVRFGTDWEADARRRDFTMNALYAGPDGRILDPVGGYEDLVAGRVRFIGDPDRRIAEDHLRILRFFRFHARYGTGGLDPAGLAAGIRARNALRALSGERVRQEVLRLLGAPGAPDAVETMSDSGILQVVLGGVGRVARLRRLATLEAVLGEPADEVRRLGVLAVDVVEDAERLTERLRLSRAESKRLNIMPEGWRAIARPDDEVGARRALYRHGAEAYGDRIRHLAARQATGEAELRRWADLVTLPARWTAPAFPMSGGDLLAMGARGRRIGEILRRLEDEWIDEGYRLDRDALTARARALLD